jgi:hypothetical protein
MTVSGWLTIFLFVGILTALAIPLGNYMAAVYTGERTFMDRILGGPERLLYRVMRVDTARGMDWKAYAKSHDHPGELSRTFLEYTALSVGELSLGPYWLGARGRCRRTNAKGRDISRRTGDEHPGEQSDHRQPPGS